MKRTVLILVFLATISNYLQAQSYMLARGLPLAEISGSGTAITGLSDENNSSALPIGFSFSFYGNTYTSFYVGSNGVITFGSGKRGPVGTALPNSSATNTICFANTDLHCGAGTPTINYFTSGTAPNRILVVNFKNVQHYYNSGNLTSVQIQLYEGAAGKIEIHNTSNIAGGYTRTIGIENSDNTAYLTEASLNNSSSINITNETIRFSLPTPCSASLSLAASQNQVCEGQTSTLTATPSSAGSYTYQWFLNSTLIPGATSGTYPATKHGTYQAKITGAGNCESYSNTIAITRPFVPTASGSTTTICGVNPANLSVAVSPTGSYTYQWQRNGSNISGATSATYAATTTGNYKVRVTSGACAIFSDSIAISNDTAPTITLNQNPSNATTLCQYGYVNMYPTITPTPSGSYTYQWFKNNQAVTGINSYGSFDAYEAGTYKIKITKPNGCAYESSTVTFTVPYTVNVSPDSSSLCTQTPLTSTVSVPGTYTYQWYRDGSSISGATQSTYTPRQTGNYRLLVTGTSCKIYSDLVKVTVLNSAYVNTNINGNTTSSQTNYLLCAGGSIPVTTSAYNGGTISYQWFKNGVAINGATASNYTITSVGKYLVKISNSGNTCTVRSDTIKVIQGTVPTITSITFTGNPSNFVICENQTNSYIQANISPSGSYQYQWYLNNAKVGYGYYYVYYDSDQNIGTGNYKVEVSPANSFGCGVMSGVQAVTAKFSVAVTPATFDFCGTGAAPNLVGSVAAGTYTYKWQTKSASNSYWSTISGATSTTYQTKTYTGSDTNSVNLYRFTVTRTSDNCAVGATSTLTQAFGAGLSSPFNSVDTVKICAGGTIKIKGYAYQKGSFVFQLYKDNVASGSAQSISNTTSNLYTESSDFNITSAGTYYIRVTRNGCSINTKKIIVLSTTTPDFTVNTTPADPRICPSGSGITLSSTIGGNLSVNYTTAWYKDTTRLSTYNSYYTSQTGVYQVRVTPSFGGCTVTKNVEVKPLFDINITPTSGSFCNNTPITISTSIPQSNTYTYEWQKKDIGGSYFNYINGATSSTYTPTSGGTYRVRVYKQNSPTCYLFSDTVRITQPFTVSISNSSDKICFGQNVVFSSTVVGTGPFTYQWYNGATLINGATSATYSTTVAGTYSVRVSKSGCTINSTSIAITQGSSTTPFTVSVSGTNNGRVCAGSYVQITGTVSPAGTYTYSWTKDNENYYSSSSSISPSSAGVYQLKATDAGGCSAVATPYTVTKPNIQVSITTPTNTTLCNPIGLNANVLPAGGTYYYQWQQSSSEIFGAISSSYNASEAGYYKLIVYGADGCGVESNTVQLYSPFSNGSTRNNLVGSYYWTNNYCPGQSVQLEASSTLASGVSGDVTYSWTGPKNFSSNLQNPVLTNVTEGMTGEYKVAVKVSGACNYTDTYYSYTTNVKVKPVVASIGGNDGVCNNGSLSLYANISNPNVSATYSWAGPNSFTSTGYSINRSNFTAASAGIYTVTVTVGGQCAATVYARKKTYVINTAGYTAYAYNSNSSDCSTIYLSASGSISTDTYSWAGPNGFTSTSSSPSIPRNAAAVGIYTVTLTRCGATATATTQVTSTCQVSGGGGTQYASLYVASQRNFAPGSLILIQPSVSPGGAENTFSWTGPNGFTSTSKSLVIPNASDSHEGVYTLTATFKSGYSPTSSTASVLITVDSPPFNDKIIPTLNFSNNNLCVGENLDTDYDLTAYPNDAENYAIYSWQGPNGFSSDAKEPLFPNIAANRAGTYTVTAAFYGNYTGTVTATTTIGINPKAIITANDKICSGSSSYISAGLSFYESTPNVVYTYSWQGPNGFTNTNSGATITAPGTYTVTITKTGGFCDGTFTATKTITALTGFEAPTELTATTSPLNGLSTNGSVGNYKVGNSFRLSSYYSGTVISYSWTGPNGFTSNLQSPIIFSAGTNRAGTYTLVANVRVSGCNGTTSTVNVTKTVIINISQCQPIVNLFSPNDNINSGTIIKEAGEYINASNKILGGQATYRSNKAITLLPGFSANTGAIFRTEYGGCN